MMKQPALRSLLPAPPKDDHNNEQQQETQQEVPSISKDGHTAKREILSKVACENCRRRKTKCTGQRPSCAYCMKQKVPCHYSVEETDMHRSALKRKYDHIQQSNDVYKQIFSLLQTAPETIARDVLQRIRTSGDPATVLRYTQDGDLLLQLVLSPENERLYEVPYGTALPEILQKTGSPYFACKASRIYLDQKNTSLKAQRSPLSQYHLPCKPYFSAELVDSRLAKVTCLNWTTVITDDELLRKLLGSYLLTEYTNYTFFQKDLFLDDMIANRQRYCSSLLLNTILGAACSCYFGLSKQNEFWNPNTLLYRFLAEVRLQRDLLNGAINLPTIQANMILSTIYDMHGMNRLSTELQMEIVQMSNSYGLFFDSPAVLTDNTSQRAKNFTAWGFFAYQALRAVNFSSLPLLKDRPAAALPDPLLDPSWYGELQAAYPSAPKPVSLKFADDFKAKAELRVITNEYCFLAFDKNNSEPAKRKVSTQSLLSRLDSWHHNLPTSLLDHQLSSPAQFRLHMEYHTMLAFTRQLIIAMEAEEKLIDESVNTIENLRDTVAREFMQIEILLRLYYLQHGFKNQDTLLSFWLAMMGNRSADTLQQQNDETVSSYHRSTWILSIQGLKNIGEGIHLARVTSCVIRDRGSKADTGILDVLVPEPRAYLAQSNLAEYVRSDWLVPVPVAKGATSTLDELVKQIEDLRTTSDIIGP